MLGLGFILLCQISVNAWLLTHGEAVVHNTVSTLKSCTMIFDPSLSVAASSSAWLPLLYDTVVFSLLAYRIVPMRRDPYQGYTTRVILTRLLEDGLIYYIVICTVTLVLTLMIVFAEPGSKNITAQLELLLTVTMMSRITLSLKKSAANVDQSNPDNLSMELIPNVAHTRDEHSPRSPLTG
ncbi:hypothetical protein Agabi119p4_7763 [Agaricus bisporus var. burnettii]|uniref:Ion transport domain-containing protein n=1 Tax=Agaricus bisporus var. burnettii TaxID=192524 RepID=A0A8H7C8W2_AGABI|nr:hypothetical protein Agabi119p4_7763 [Agaricus bisporus var. burnettii]